MCVSGDPTDADASPGALESALIAYLDAHPYACDTADGILEWWLQGSQRWSLAEVEQVLEQLVRAGTLGRLPALDGRVRYRRVGGQP